ncbi:dihydrolipoyl dehydrogenase [Sutcliffiella rhizosphaerae]|uniref:Dihydrolipoyl dehydrogenase n=1 Tax=Sutcliffiella rhizosphaerae TaxID=2880967 RepID=A0ABM8YRW6_9BACI|nr:dihydrolipoyl dehydrogenase [Sutcliffiella rhizosphaerae]CAG9622739.1 Dihydrolipoyl dehydrogenase [Sutcliffiella rhizosphaerae]
MKEVVVIGGGPGGYSAALRASQLGASVTLIEKSLLGGTCLNTGCIPTKSLLDSSYLWSKSNNLFQMHTNQAVPWDHVMSRKQKAVTQLRRGVASLLKAGKIRVVEGIASLSGTNQIYVHGDNSQTLHADFIILATGSRPILPPIEGIETEGVLTSNEILSLQKLPPSLSIIGGGVIGIEFATIFAELGVKVHVIEAADRILPNMDRAISEQLQAHLEKQGVHFSLENKVTAIGKSDKSEVQLTVNEGQMLTSDLVLVAVGREAVIGGLQLEENGVMVENKKIKTNSYQQTSISSIYAVGDCSTSIMLAHVAMAESKVAIEHALEYETKPVIYDYIPQCVYTHPEAAAVGLTKEEAVKRGFEVEEGVFPLQANGRALIEEETVGFLKVIADKEYGRILGVHLLMPHATEVISQATLALQLEATTEELLNMVYPHPSITEGIQEAVMDMTNSAIHLPSLEKV